MKIKDIVSKQQSQNRRNNLISALQEIQVKNGYLPMEKIIECANHLGIPLIDVYGVATFYKSFSLKPRGRHLITVCTGTACHVRGAGGIANEITRMLGIKPGETTEDGEFSFDTVMCLGCCAIGPIMVLDGKYYGKMTPTKISSIIRKVREEQVIWVKR